MRTIVITAVMLATLTSMSGTSHSAEPDPGNSIVPSYIDLVGMHQGVPDPAGAFSVTVRDNANQPVAGVVVTLDFSGCPDLAPASDQPYSGLTVDCGAATVSATTDVAGIARFVIVGSVLHRSPASTAGCAVIRAGPNDVVLGQTSVAVYDQDGVNGVGANDLSLWFCDWCPVPILCPPQTPRNDYDHNDGLQTDFAQLIDRYFDETSTATGARCDGQPTTKSTLHADQGGLNAAWTECSTGGGTTIAGFACDTNSGAPHSVVFSVVAPPGITALTAFEAEAIVIGNNPNQPLPDWWRFDPQGCRSSSMTISLPNSQSTSSCEDALVGATLSSRMYYPYVEQYGGRIRVVGFIGPPSPVALTVGQEYGLFRLTINNSKTTGSGACTGCDQPVQIVFRWVKLVQGGSCAEPAIATMSGEPDVLIDYPASSSRVYWQSTFTDVDPAPAPVALHLSRVGANPQGELTVEFSLPVAEPASLELFDVRGRRISSTKSDASPGVHRVTLAKSGELGPGLYFVKLQQGGRSTLLKASVIQ